jgi:hypothetical protein
MGNVGQCVFTDVQFFQRRGVETQFLKVDSGQIVFGHVEHFQLRTGMEQRGQRGQTVVGQV